MNATEREDASIRGSRPEWLILPLLLPVTGPFLAAWLAVRNRPGDRQTAARCLVAAVCAAVLYAWLFSL